MSETLDLGRRIELVSMDPHFHDISIALYRQAGALGPVFLVHSYSKQPGARERLERVALAMAALGGMTRLPDEPRKLRFRCGSEHPAACRRLFLEACKLAPDQPLEARPMAILDKKSGRTITVVGEGEGVYRIAADGDEADKASRIAAVANGLAKLGEMRLDGARVVFACGHAHDALVGMLLVRALNVRAVLREEEMSASRGVLAAPSAQR
jgi:hypothetical protein